MPDTPNIILCMCDQLRAHEVGCYGNEVIRTPHIDRLASEGTRFEHGISNAPVCMAARSMVLSGQFPRTCAGTLGNVAHALADGGAVLPEYPVHGRPHLPDMTLPECLREAGYDTAAIGKWHIHSWPHDVGFDEYVIPRVHHCQTGQSYTENGGPEFVPDQYSVDFEVERVERFLQNRRNADQPFFLYYNIGPPHCPVADGPAKYLDMYDPREIPLRPNVDEENPTPTSKDSEQALKIYRWDFRYYQFALPYTQKLPDGYGIREAIAEYYGMTTWVDDAVGRMLRALEATGLAEDTIVVFTSDHGDNLGSHGYVQKGRLIEESIRVPLVMRGPGVAPGQVQASQVASLLNMMPTLLDFAGLDAPPHLHGCSFAPAARGASQTTPENHAFIETGKDGVGVRTPTHLYGLPWDGNGGLGAQPNRFYDLTGDPYELHNLAETGEQADTAKELDAALRAWHERTPWLQQRRARQAS